MHTYTVKCGEITAEVKACTHDGAARIFVKFLARFTLKTGRILSLGDTVRVGGRSTEALYSTDALIDQLANPEQVGITSKWGRS